MKFSDCKLLSSLGLLLLTASNTIGAPVKPVNNERYLTIDYNASNSSTSLVSTPTLISIASTNITTPTTIPTGFVNATISANTTIIPTGFANATTSVNATTSGKLFKRGTSSNNVDIVTLSFRPEDRTYIKLLLNQLSQKIRLFLERSKISLSISGDEAINLKHKNGEK